MRGIGRNAPRTSFLACSNGRALIFTIRRQAMEPDCAKMFLTTLATSSAK